MSAKVVNRLAFTEFRQVRSPIKLRRPKGPTAAEKERIKRDLFGPVDREASRRFIFCELSKQQEQASKKWGFDFLHGHPLNSNAQFSWERVPPTIVPEMYALSRAAHTREISCDTVTEAEILQDIRAAAADNVKSNFYSSLITSTNIKTTRIQQKKITDYLQERKRPSTSSVKRLTPASPAKKLRRAISMCETSTLRVKKSI